MTRRVVDTPIGQLTLVARGGRLVAVGLPGTDPPDGEDLDPTDERVLDRAARQLTEYFSGVRRHFELPLALDGGPFHRRAQLAMADIPYGQVLTYGQLAARLGVPRAARAVGQACRRNPLPIVLPCHRVVAADGGIGGYAGGADLKRALLAHEGVHLEDGRGYATR